jgi:hypothetical protein
VEAEPVGDSSEVEGVEAWIDCFGCFACFAGAAGRGRTSVRDEERSLFALTSRFSWAIESLSAGRGAGFERDEREREIESEELEARELELARALGTRSVARDLEVGVEGEASGDAILAPPLAGLSFDLARGLAVTPVL